MKPTDLDTAAVAQGSEIAIKITESAPTPNTDSKYALFCKLLWLGDKPDSCRPIGRDICLVILEAVQKESPTSLGEIMFGGSKNLKIVPFLRD